MLLAIYKYKIDAFLNKSIPPLNNPILCYRTYDSYLKENKILFFKNKWEGEYIQVGSWDYFFDGYVPDEYWNFIPSELKEYKEIPGFSHIDYLGINLLINKMFCVFDINKHYYRKELAKIHYQYHVSCYQVSDDIRTFFIRKLFSEMWVGDYAYNKVTVKNGELIFAAESGIVYQFHDLIDRLCDIIKIFSLPESLLNILDSINPMLHECIDFILGRDGAYDFDDVNKKYIDGNYFVDIYQNNKESIFNVLKDCVRESQTSHELLVSHLIIRNYSFFVLKDKPDEILILKYFLSKDEEIFTEILSLTIDIGFCVWKDTFDGLNLEEYLEKVKESDCLIDR